MGGGLELGGLWGLNHPPEVAAERSWSLRIRRGRLRFRRGRRQGFCLAAGGYAPTGELRLEEGLSGTGVGHGIRAETIGLGGSDRGSGTQHWFPEINDALIVRSILESGLREAKACG